MKTIHTKAYAKINLALDVVSRREDGFHNLRMVMLETDLSDELSITLGTGEKNAILCTDFAVSSSADNLAFRAADMYLSYAQIEANGFFIHLSKKIPAAAGLGGGSADAAAVLKSLQNEYKALKKEELFTLALKLGSDVPFALQGGCSLAAGRGEILTPLSSFPSCFLIICTPDFPVSTPDLYHAIDKESTIFHPDTELLERAVMDENLDEIGINLGNSFFPLISRNHPEILNIINIMNENGAIGASMSGSGPSLFGIFKEKSLAQGAFKILRESYPNTFLTEAHRC